MGFILQPIGCFLSGFITGIAGNVRFQFSSKAVNEWHFYSFIIRRVCRLLISCDKFSSTWNKIPNADPLGRKRAMFIVNIPFIIGWLMLYLSKSVVEIFIAYSLLGFGIGLVEAPIISYLGEITEPRLRGLMLGYASISVTLGASFVFFLNTLIAWRTVALVCLFIPISAMIGLLFVNTEIDWLEIYSNSNSIQCSFSSRSQKHRTGCCPKIERPKQNNR